MEFTPKQRYTMQDLLDIVRILREPGGCPWDREQTHQSIRSNLIEETYEVAEAIDQEDALLLREELGDLLLQIALHTQMEAETGAFTFEDVCTEICQKLVYRHPHVFGTVQAQDAQEVLVNWEQLKNEEKGRVTAAHRLDSVPQSLPALMHSAKVQKRAAAYGFGYSTVQDALADLESEVHELRLAVDAGEGVPHELGDVLFSAVNVARMAGMDAEEQLAQCSRRFAARVKQVEQFAEQQGQTLEQLDDATRDVMWKKAKGLE